MVRWLHSTPQTLTIVGAKDASKQSDPPMRLKCGLLFAFGQSHVGMSSRESETYCCATYDRRQSQPLPLLNVVHQKNQKYRPCADAVGSTI
jgi:hypothetical protein